MIILKNVQRPEGTVCDAAIKGPYSQEIDGKGLMMLPALIDPHVHFRTPGAEHKENWISGAQAALQGGATTVIDMPNNTPNCTTVEVLKKKHSTIREQLDAAGIPLRYHLYLGADKKHLHEISKAKGLAAGIKVFMGSSTGDLLIDDDAALEEIFKIAGSLDMLVSVHAEDEEIIKQNRAAMGVGGDPAIHSRIRSPSAAAKAVEKALNLSQKYNTRLCILHVSSKEELKLIKQAKRVGIPVFAEATPHHLLLSTDDYQQWGTRVLVNPPLREVEDQEALWQAIREGTIDCIGTDHAPHTLEEKAQPYGKAPSGIAAIDLLLPLLLEAVHQGKIDIPTLIKLTTTNVQKIFQLEPNNDVVLVDMGKSDSVRDEDLRTKCGWSPYAGRKLRGWPVYTIVQGKVFKRSKHAHAH